MVPFKLDCPEPWQALGVCMAFDAFNRSSKSNSSSCNRLVGIGPCELNAGNLQLQTADGQACCKKCSVVLQGLHR